MVNSGLRLGALAACVLVAVGLQGCLAVGVAGAVVGAGGSVVGTSAKVVTATGRAIIPGESKKAREKREYEAWKKSHRKP